MKARAQSSMEYLIIVGLAFLVMIPATYLFFNFSRESSQEISFYQLERIGRDIVDTGESLFYAGTGSKTVLRVSIPREVEKISIIDQRELVFNVSTSMGYSDFVFISRVNLTTAQGCGLGSCLVSDIGSGVRNIRIEALNDSVLLADAQ